MSDRIRMGPIVPTLTASASPNRGGRKGMKVAYPLAMRGRADGAELEMGDPEIYNSLRAGDGGSSRQNALLTPDLAVRRLTPRECERLMGWPDDHTRWADDGTEIADSHRYRMCGNGVVAPVAEWIGRRLPMEVAA
jgi:DNA (cytosine-5)-methyltransferase 1